MKRRYERHEDFVKCVLCTMIGPIDVLISAGADSAIIVWDARSGQRLYTLRGHARGVTAMAIDPYSDLPKEQEEEGTDGSNYVILFSGDSNREVRRWLLKPNEGKYLPQSSPTPAEQGNYAMFGGASRALSTGTGAIIAHETSIYALKFDESGDLWTASADRTAKRLVRDHGWQADTSLEHPDFVGTSTFELGILR
jgi:WD40 repeat protein